MINVFHIYLGYCIGENRDYYENKRRNVKNNNSTIDEEINERCDKLFGFTGPTGKILNMPIWNCFSKQCKRNCSSFRDGQISQDVENILFQHPAKFAFICKDVWNK